MTRAYFVERFSSLQLRSLLYFELENLSGPLDLPLCVFLFVHCLQLRHHVGRLCFVCFGQGLQ